MKKDFDQWEKIRQRYLNVHPYNKMDSHLPFSACVGENGEYGQNTIRDGFKDAVEVLVSSLSSRDTCADSLVYPILFCFRHTVELYLKEIYVVVNYILNMKNHPNETIRLRKLSILHTLISKRVHDKDNQSIKDRIEKEIDCLCDKYLGQQEPNIHTHDILKLKEEIVNIYHVDKRIYEAFNPVLEYLKYYDNIDKGGDVFRYLTDRKGNPHLKGKGIDSINILTVYVHYKEISEILEITIEILEQLVKEYEIGTFTKNLSREQLGEISKKLPKPQNFGSEIKEAKKRIKEEYGISSNEFDKALKIIKKHREFSYNMGKEIPIPFLSKDTLKKFGRCAMGKEDWKKIVREIEIDELYFLKVFLEISGWNKTGYSYAYYSEDLHYLYQLEKIENRISSYDISPKNHISHIIDGMKKCGQITFANILSEYVFINDKKNI